MGTHNSVQFGDEAFHIWEQSVAWEFALSDFRFILGPKLKDGAQLLTAIHEINPLQRMAMMTGHPKEAREKLPDALRGLPVLCKPFRIEQVMRLLREPVLPL
jgi:hypothetical protein